MRKTKIKKKTLVAVALVVLSIAGTVAGFSILIKRKAGVRIFNYKSPNTKENKDNNSNQGSGNGGDFYKKGVVSGKDTDGSPISKEDYCFDCEAGSKNDSGECLREYNLDEKGVVRSQDVTCEFGCADGACQHECVQ